MSLSRKQLRSVIHFAQHYWAQGWADGEAWDKIYNPPRYNKDDRPAYTQGFNEARETRRPKG